MFYTAITINSEDGQVAPLRMNAPHDNKEAWREIRKHVRDGYELLAIVRGDHPVYNETSEK